jgi:hypothetical protein
MPRQRHLRRKQLKAPPTPRLLPARTATLVPRHRELVRRYRPPTHLAQVRKVQMFLPDVIDDVLAMLSVSVRTALASAPALPLARTSCPAALDGTAVLFLRVAVYDGEVIFEVLAIDEDGLAAVVDETCHDVAVGRERRKSHSKSRSRSRSCYSGDSGFHVRRVTK